VDKFYFNAYFVSLQAAYKSSGYCNKKSSQR